MVRIRKSSGGVKSASKMATQSLGERAGFEPVAVGPVVVRNRIAQRGVAFYQRSSYFYGFIGGIVEQLDIELFTGIIQAADGLQQTLDHVLLIEDRQLDGDAG
jgi:hypothetical protein